MQTNPIESWSVMWRAVTREQNYSQYRTNTSKAERYKLNSRKYERHRWESNLVSWRETLDTLVCAQYRNIPLALRSDHTLEPKSTVDLLIILLRTIWWFFGFFWWNIGVTCPEPTFFFNWQTILTKQRHLKERRVFSKILQNRLLDRCMKTSLLQYKPFIT